MDVEGLKAASDGRTKILLVCTPSNPTGSILTEEQIDDLLDHCTRAGIFLVLDEAYADFSEAYRSPAASFARGEAEGAVTRTFSKAHGLAGLRIGYCIAPEEVVTYINLVRMPFNASTIAQEAALAALEDRERLATTGVGDGVAIPHAKLNGIGDNRMAVGISRSGVSFESVDGKPVHIFFALIAPLSSAGDHLRILAQISRLLKDADVRGRLVQAGSPEELIDIIKSESGDQ